MKRTVLSDDCFDLGDGGKEKQTTQIQRQNQPSLRVTVTCHRTVCTPDSLHLGVQTRKQRTYFNASLG